MKPFIEPTRGHTPPTWADIDWHAVETNVGRLQERIYPGSVLILQAEKAPLLDRLPDLAKWDDRKYGRNHLLFFVKEPEQNTVEMVQAAERETTSEERA